MTISRQARYRGALLGLAAGDALGTTLELSAPGSFTPLTDMVGGGPCSLQPGEWTDDTSMALCLAESLIERREFDPVDQLDRYVRWFREGHLSSNGRCFDIGTATAAALRRFERSRAPCCGSEDPRTAGNGSIMRLAPVPLFFARRPLEAITRAAESSRTTHGAPEAVDACRDLAALLVGAVNAAEKTALVAAHFEPVPGVWRTAPLGPKIVTVASGAFKEREPPEIRGTGYVVDCLEAARWAFERSQSFAGGALLAVNLGDDADTTGAVYGQVAGAFYGDTAIPERWRARLAHRDLIVGFADRRFELAESLGVADEARLSDLLI